MKHTTTNITRSHLFALVAIIALSSCSSAPALPPACHAKPESGRCKASILRYWYDDRAGTCKAFIWGGCGGTAPFEKLEDCHARCMAGQPLPDQPATAQEAVPARSPTAIPQQTPAAPAAPAAQ